MPPAIIAAGVGAAASIGGSMLSNSASKKATKSANKTAEKNTKANNALAREQYAMNSANLLPYSANGLRAGNALNEMLLGPVQAPMQAPQQTQQYGAPVPAGGVAVSEFGEYGSRSGGAPSMMESFARADNIGGMFGGLQDAMRSRYETGMTPQPQTGGYAEPGQPQNGQATDADRYAWAYGAPPPQAAGQQPLPGAMVNAQPSAWDQFRNSTNYQFRLNEGLKGLNQGYAANGMLESGAAMKGITEYGQNFAANELGNYQDRLAQQQGVGLGAVSALAGVGQNMVSNVTANNNSAAQVAAQGAIQNGAARGQMYGSIASGIGQVAGAFGGSSYRPQNALMAPIPQYPGGNYLRPLGG